MLGRDRVLGLVSVLCLALVLDGPAVASAQGGTIGSGPPVPPQNMAAHCRDQVASGYRVLPLFIRMKPRLHHRGTGTTIEGRIVKRHKVIGAFTCRFDGYDRFIGVARMTPGGK